MVDDLNSPSPTKKKSPTSLSSSGVKKKKKDVEVEVEEPPPLRSVHSPNLTSLPLANYSQDMELQAQKVCSSYDEFDYDDDDDDASGESCSDYQLLSENEKYLLEESDQDEESGDESDDDMKIETDNTSESEDEDDDEEEEDGEEAEEEEKEEDPDEEKETKPENDDKREENFLKDYCYNFYKLKNLKEAEKLLSQKQHLIYLLSNEVKITNLSIFIKQYDKTVIFQVELQKHRVANFEQKHLKEKLVGLVLFSFTKVSCVVKSSFYTLLIL